jgi:DNA primase catalytic core
MPRIPDEELERIKSQVKVTDLCREYGIELKQMGPDNLMGKCPFHDDRDPSFGVTPSKNLWNCLAGCGGGDTIQLAMRKEGVSFRHAVERLQRRLGIAPEAPTIKTRSGTTHPALVDAETELADHILLQHVMDYYHQTFCNELKAMKYLQHRCCFDAEAVKHFRIGYANRTLGYRVPATTATGKRLKAQLQRLGIMRGSGHEHLTGSVVIPILDEHGNVVQMYGRKITPNLREGTPQHLYLPGERRAVWNAAPLKNQKEWLLCESLIDALTLWCAGFRNVTCSYGVNGFTAAHWALLEEAKPARIVICYDNDPAGNAAAAKLAEQLRARGIKVARAKLPPGKDINDVARENKDARVALAIALESPAEMPGMDGPPTLSPPMPQPAPASSLAALPAAATDEAAKEERLVPDAAPASLLAAASSPGPAEAAKERGLPPPAAPAASSLAADPIVTPSAAAKEPPATDEVFFTFGPRQWRVRGIGKNLSFESLRVQLRVLVQGGAGQGAIQLSPGHAGPVQRQAPPELPGPGPGGNPSGRRPAQTRLGAGVPEGRGVAGKVHPGGG